MSGPDGSPPPSDQIVDLADHGVVLIGPAQEVLRWNAWMAAHSGIGEASALGRTLDALFQAALAPRVRSAIADCLAHARSHILSPSLNRRPFPLTGEGERPDQRGDIEQLVTIKPVRAADGDRWCLIQITDVTLAARRERFLRRQAHELSHVVERLRAASEVATRASVAKSEFLTNMSHELRSPLNAIIGFSQLLGMRQAGPLTDEQAEYVTYIRKAGDHLIRMITDILDLTRIEARRLVLELHDFEVDRFVLDGIKGVKALSQARGITVRYAPWAGGGLTVHADRTRLAQILINLLSNALKYNRLGGSVTVSAAALPEGRVRVAVSDTGPGIPLERQGELFQSFNRLGAEFGEIEGAGIGLALSRNLAEAMDGAMGFESAPGEGSTFWVDIPMAPSSEANGGAAGTGIGDGAPGLPALPPFTLLHVEDNPVDLRLVEGMFRSVAGARLVTARTGAEAVRVAREARPDVILLDIHLPDITGFEVLRRLRADEATRAIPVFAISASAGGDDITRGLAAGFHKWLTKPLEVGELLSALAGPLKADKGGRREPP